MKIVAKSGAEGAILTSQKMPIEAAVTAARNYRDSLTVLASCQTLDCEMAAKLMALGASGLFFEGNCTNEKLKTFGMDLSTIIGSLGIGNIRDLSPENLRTNDQNTAAMTGVPIAGYDSVLPMWRH